MKKEDVEKFKKACEIANKKTRHGSANTLIVHPDMAKILERYWKKQERLKKLNELKRKD